MRPCARASYLPLPGCVKVALRRHLHSPQPTGDTQALLSWRATARRVIIITCSLRPATNLPQLASRALAAPPPPPPPTSGAPGCCRARRARETCSSGSKGRARAAPGRCLFASRARFLRVCGRPCGALLRRACAAGGLPPPAPPAMMMHVAPRESGDVRRASREYAHPHVHPHGTHPHPHEHAHHRAPRAPDSAAAANGTSQAPHMTHKHAHAQSRTRARARARARAQQERNGGQAMGLRLEGELSWHPQPTNRLARETKTARRRGRTATCPGYRARTSRDVPHTLASVTPWGAARAADTCGWRVPSPYDIPAGL